MVGLQQRRLGLWGALRVSAHIVFLNLHHLLHLPALSFLLFYILKALALQPSLYISVLFSLSLVFFLSLNKRDVDDLRPYPTLTPNPYPIPRFLAELCFVIVSIMTPMQLNQVYEPAGIMIFCRNFAILAMLGVTAGAVYIVLTTCSLDKGYPLVEERRGWVNEMIRWSIDFVHIHIWVAAGAAWLALLVSSLSPHLLPSCIQAKPVMWRWVAAGVCVGAMPLFFLCVMSTHAALYLSCRTHHKQLSYVQYTGTIPDETSAVAVSTYFANSLKKE